MTTKQMIEKIRDAVNECTAGEEAVYEALCDEAEGWKMRLREIERENEDGEEDD